MYRLSLSKRISFRSVTLRQEIGKEGERLACDYLTRKGYQILHRNYRFSRAEIDIVARDGSDLVFVEVKTRSYLYYGTPETSVREKKKRLMIDAAHHYVDTQAYEGDIRFDIVAILLGEGEKHQLTHFEDAFFPGLG